MSFFLEKKNQPFFPGSTGQVLKIRLNRGTKSCSWQAGHAINVGLGDIRWHSEPFTPRVLLGRCPVKQIKYTYLPESSKGLKFKALNYQKQTWGLKFDTLGGPRYIHIKIINIILYHNAHLRIPYLARLVSCWSTPPPKSDKIMFFGGNFKARYFPMEPCWKTLWIPSKVKTRGPKWKCGGSCCGNPS